MSSKASKAPEPNETWVSGRSRWGLSRIRMGRDKRWHFSGQQPDEFVRLVVRKHWWFLIAPGLPLIGSILALMLVFWASTVPALKGMSVFWQLLEFGVGFLLLVTGGWFAYRDLAAWWVETYIITNKRIVDLKGVLQPTRQETPLDKVTQVAIDLDSFLGFIFSYGTLHLYLTGGELKLKDVPNPRKVKEALVGNGPAPKGKPAPIPVPQDQELATLLAKLAKGKDVPTLQDADAGYPKRGDDRHPGPRRTFGGPLHITSGVQYSSGEFTAMYIQRSRYVLYRNLSIPVLGLLITLPLPFVFTWLWLVVSVVILLLLISMGLIYVNYVDDVYILSNKRIIDIDRRLVFFYEQRHETEYKNIRDIRVRVSNVFQRLLDVGNVEIETPGSSPNIILKQVDHPFIVQDQVYAIKNYKDRVDAVKKANEPKEELQKWFSQVVSALEKKIQFEGAPNLRLMDFWNAVDMASDYGLRVVAIGEDQSYTELSPGTVVRQNPPPGTLMAEGGEIQVTLSKRAGTGPLFDLTPDDGRFGQEVGEEY